MKTLGAAGLGSVFASCQIETGSNDPNASEKEQKHKYPQIPRRKLGKTGIKVPCLSLGGEINYVKNQVILRKALDWGVSYWDTAHWYVRGNSELGIGKFLAKNPEIRRELFIATKASGAENLEEVEERLQLIHRLKRKYGIPRKNQQGIMVIFGYPAFKYQRAIKRRFANIYYY